MVKKTTKTAQKTASTKKAKPVAKTSAAKKPQSQKVDYYPNRVPLLVATLAAVTLLALAFMGYL
jgi:hypothetical protein